MDDFASTRNFCPNSLLQLQTVKTWIPISAVAWTSAWHHIALVNNASVFRVLGVAIELQLEMKILIVYVFSTNTQGVKAYVFLIRNALAQTLRFARVNRPGSTDPNVALSQVTCLQLWSNVTYTDLN